MKISNAGVDNLVVTSSDEQNSLQSQELRQEGEVIQGVITNVSDLVSISFSDREVQVPRSTVPDAKEGDIKEFQIKEVSNKSIVLKEIENSTNNESKGIYCTTVESERTIFLAKDTSEKQDVTKVAKTIKKQLNDLSKTVTGDDISELNKQDGDYSEYSSDQLEKTIEHVKERRKFNDKQLQSQIDKKQIQRSQVEDLSNDAKTDTVKEEEIAKKLEESNLPVTDENIQRIALAMELSQSILKLNDNSSANLINNQESLSISNIYKAVYSGQVSPNVGVTESDFSNIQSQIEGIITSAGLEVNETTLSQAKWLLSKGLPVTEETLLQLEQINQIQENYSSNDMMDQIIEGMSEGQNPVDVVLGNRYLEDAIQIVQDVARITDQAVDQVVGQNQPVTIENLTSAENASQTGVLFEDTSIEAITAHRQLEEVRLQLTVENAYKLMKQGIQVNTCELEEVVNHLKELENSYYKGLLEDQNVVGTEDTVSTLRDTVETYQGLMNAPCVILGESLSNKDEMTMASLYADGKRASDAFNAMNERYETLMTKPRQDMGDSIQKAFRNVDDILENANMELTEDNRRAVRILGYNEMEINEESIISMKEYDAKVNNMLNKMNPAVVVKMIKEQVNPLSMSIDELNQKLNSLSDDSLLTDEKFSEYLYNLDKNKELTEEQRNSYIGIYRLLHQVQKSDGAAIGSVVQSDQELTLNNLLTAVRIRKGSGIDQSIDESFAGKVSLQTNSISDQIADGFSESDTVQYNQFVVGKLLENMDPSSLQQLELECEESNLDMYQLPIEKIKDMIAHYDNQDYDYTTEQLETFNDAMDKASTQNIEFLISNGEDVTINNLISVDQIMTNSAETFQGLRKNVKDQEKFDELINGVSESFDDKESAKEQITSLDQMVSDSIEEMISKEDISYETLDQLKQFTQNIHLMGNLSRNEYYEVPLQVGDEISTVKVSVIRGTESSGKVEMKTELPNLGTVSVDAMVKNDKLKALVLCDNQEGIQALKASSNTVTEAIENSGLEIDYLDYNLEQAVRNKKITYNTTNDDEKVSTKTLYQVAKIFLTSLKQIEKEKVENNEN